MPEDQRGAKTKAAGNGDAKKAAAKKDNGNGAKKRK
jgi:hypothetical protein